ncbi:MAG: tRNA 4-thiouridine(8) synthase ThiI [Euryarchaeota archaeon]|nr:tRNA 4-thiouridine(8) synthase ThiI [Euryarchaeota archaeon]
MASHDVFVVHYHEIALKGGNRPIFEKRLAENIRRSLQGLGAGRVRRAYGRIVVELGEGADAEGIEEALRKIFGIQYFAPAKKCLQDLEEIKQAALAEASRHDSASFRIQTKRSNKAFGHTSLEVNRMVGAAVQKGTGKKVVLKDPELTVFIEVVDRDAYVYSKRVQGPGGLPTGVSGRALALISGGIDSPVAAYMMMKRGLKLTFLHFHSFPITSRASVEKVREIVKVLSEYQGPSELYTIPLGDIQKRIWTRTPGGLRMVLYRRMMLRLGERVAEQVGAKALITGESLGQVASQTLENLVAIEKAAAMPVFRPLIGQDKEEIIQKARDIGTYDISVLPHEDCCTLFVPKHPETRADPVYVEKVEEALEVGDLIEMGLDAMEKERL